ncbi:S8 family peptidase, partial [Methylobacterium mesophilicum]
MHAADAYAAGYTGLGVTVGVVDSGVYSAHPEFADGRVKPLTITGTFGADGFYFIDKFGRPIDRSPRPSIFSGGQLYSVSGAYNPVYNDPHGTEVTATIGASRDGIGMHGVSFNANVYVANTQATDEMTYGFNADYAYFKNAYGSVAAAGARAINTSWGNPPPADNYNTLEGLRSAYANLSTKLSYLDAAADVAKQFDIIQVFAAGNSGARNSSIRANAPYFRLDIEKNWVAVGAAAKNVSGSTNPADLVLADYSNRAGAAKYWYIVAPGSAITGAAPPYTSGAAWNARTWGIDPNQQTAGYRLGDGTSIAAPHATGALAVIMQRYPYMTNQQARDVLLTTAYHRNAVDGVPDANPNAPNAIWGWGVIDLSKAMKGPGQFLGPVAANLPTGTSDTWSNDISEDALVQRKQENDAEAAAWPAKKATQARLLTVAAAQEAEGIVKSVLNNLAIGLNGSDYKSAVEKAWRAADENLIVNAILIKLTSENIYWNYLYNNNYRLGAVQTLRRQIAALNATTITQVKASINDRWPQYVATAESRIASFASIPTRGSLIKTGGGTLTLTGTNSYPGGTTFAGGTLSVSRDASLGAASAPLSFDGGVLQVTGTGFTAT